MLDKLMITAILSLSVIACNSGGGQISAMQNEVSKNSPQITLGNYVAKDDPLRNILPMVSIISTKSDGKTYPGECGGIILRGYNDTPLLVTAAHCLVQKDETPLTVEVILPKDYQHPYFSNACFANPAAEFEGAYGLLEYSLRNCRHGGILGFEPGNTAVISLVASNRDRWKGDFYIPPKNPYMNVRPDLAVIPLDVEKNASIHFMNIISPEKFTIPDDEREYGWSEHSENGHPAYGKLVAEDVVNYRPNGAFLQIRSRHHPTSDFTAPGDSGGPILLKNENNSYTLEGVLMQPEHNISGKYVSTIITSAAALHEWLTEVMAMDFDKQRPLGATCILGQPCRVDLPIIDEYGKIKQ